MSAYRLPTATSLGPVYLAVADLERAVAFYESVIGLSLLGREAAVAWLGVEPTAPLLVLAGDAKAVPRPRATSGLYHVAILVPSRRDLALALQHLLDRGYPLQGASDHLVSEALYLADPDGNGLELYADRARDRWPRRAGQVQMDTLPLAVDDLLQEATPGNGGAVAWAGMAPGTRIGHVHLQVADLAASEAFYCNGLGFELMLRYGPSAMFVAAGGYHHHLGLNTWAGTGVPAPPPHAVGLRYVTIVVPGDDDRGQLVHHLQETGASVRERSGLIEVRDPADLGILIATGSSAPSPAAFASLASLASLES